MSNKPDLNSNYNHAALQFSQIAQLPMLERAVVTASNAEVKYPADILGDVRHQISL
jgi:hypothetical protein